MRKRLTSNSRIETCDFIPAKEHNGLSKVVAGAGHPRRFRSKHLFFLLLAFRMTNALLIRTYFNPDEHWQSLEVAHHHIFGYGHLTWEWRKGIRSFLHPMIFSMMYKILEVLGLDTPWFMSRAPRLLQALFSAVGDLYSFKLTSALFDYSAAKWVLFAQLTNWFMFYCINRTFSNCLETVLILVSLYYWPSMNPSPGANSSVSRKLALLTAALSSAIRPTSAISWLYVFLLETVVTPNRLHFVFLELIPIGSLVLFCTCLLDRWMYGYWVFVPLNFIKFNLLSSGGDYYGTHKWHWYFTQGFLVMLFTFTPFTIMGIIRAKHYKLSGLILWVLLSYSFLGHKEFRFVLPVLPIALIYAGCSLAAIASRTDEKCSSRSKRTFPCGSKIGVAVVFLLITNIPMALYMSLVHQRGSENAMVYLSNEARDGKVKSVLFLMPCHSTPYYSILHSNLPMRFLDCTPSDDREGPDESDRFMMDPIGYTASLAKNESLASHVVLFDSEEKVLKDFLTSHNFYEKKRFFHAHFKVDRDLQGSVVVYASAVFMTKDNQE